MSKMTKKLYNIYYNGCYDSGQTPYPTYEGNEPEHFEEYDFMEVNNNETSI